MTSLFQKIDDVMRQHRPDVVVHCAGFGLASTTNLPAYDDKTKQVNIDGTKIVVEACLKTSVTSIGKTLFFNQSNPHKTISFFIK